MWLRDISISASHEAYVEARRAIADDVLFNRILWQPRAMAASRLYTGADLEDIMIEMQEEHHVARSPRG